MRIAEVDAYATSYKATDGSSGSLSISGTTATLGGIKPGVTYSFSVVAKKALEQAQQLVHPSLRLAELGCEKAEEEAKKKADEEAKKN